MWLQDYEKLHKRGRKPAKRPSLVDLPPSVDSSPESPTDGGSDIPKDEPHTTVKEDLPFDYSDLPPVDVNEGSPPKGDPAPPRNPAGGPSQSSDQKKKEEDEGHKQMCAMLAQGYGAWLLKTHEEFRALGMPALPAQIINGVLVPSCYRAAVHFLPNVQSVYLDAGATVIAGMGTVVLQRRARMVKGQDQPAAQPPPPRKPIITMAPPPKEEKKNEDQKIPEPSSVRSGSYGI